MQAGDTVSEFTLKRIVGRGSRAVVWEGHDRSTGRRVALKILDTHAEAAPERLRAEFAAQRRVDHPNVVAVFDLLEDAGRLTLVAELVDGIDLRTYIDRHQPDRDQALRVFGGILHGLAAAHDEGLVHRDLKPSNILMTSGPAAIPKITDFGVVKGMEPPERTPSEPGARTRDLTGRGMVLGTLRYMSPEQLQDPSAVDTRADIFSAGCILFELLTHQRCFDGPNRIALMNAVRTGAHTPFPEGFDPDLRALIEDMLAPDPQQRPASARAVLKRLDVGEDDWGDLSVSLMLESPAAAEAPARRPLWVPMLGLGLGVGLLLGFGTAVVLMALYFLV